MARGVRLLGSVLCLPAYTRSPGVSSHHLAALPPHPLPPAQVYRGEWLGTPVAVKLLLAKSQLRDEGALQRAIHAPNPTLARLHEEADIM